MKGLKQITEIFQYFSNLKMINKKLAENMFALFPFIFFCIWMTIDDENSFVLNYYLKYDVISNLIFWGGLLFLCMKGRDKWLLRQITKLQHFKQNL